VVAGRSLFVIYEGLNGTIDCFGIDKWFVTLDVDDYFRIETPGDFSDPVAAA